MDAYADRSTAQSQYVIAAFLARANDWTHLQLEWARVLDWAGVETFHMTDFISRQKEYASWDDKKCSGVLTSLLRIITGYVDYGCAAILTQPGYDALMK